MDLKPIHEELAIIGLVVGGRVSDTKSLARLSPECFSHQQVRKAFGALQDLIRADGRANLWGLEQGLSRRYGQAETDEIMCLVRDAAGATTFQGWQLDKLVTVVQEAAQRRKLMGIGEALSRAAADEQRDLSEVLDSARNAVRACSQSSGRITLATDAIVTAYDAAFQQRQPVSTGIGELDAILCGGLHDGELSVLGARPAVGKSSVLLQVARSAAKNGKQVLFVSLEMSAKEYGDRLLSVSSGVNGGILRSGKPVTEKVAEKLMMGLERAAADGVSNLALLTASPLTVESLAQEVQAWKDSNGLDVLVIDYLQLLHTRQRTASDFERIGIVSRSLKGLALTLDIPILTAAQVRRQNSNGGSLRAPGLDELRGSGDIEQDADAVWLLHRVESPEDSVLQTAAYQARHAGLLEGAQMQKMQLLTVEVAKQRQGTTGRAWVVFDPAHMTFIDPKVRDAD